MLSIKLKASLATVILGTLLSPLSQAAMSDAQLVTAMRADLKKSIKTLKAPKVIFHWVDASDINPSGQFNAKYPSTAPHYLAYVQKQGKKVYNARSSRDYDVEGPGLYMASNPVASRSYGGMRTFGLIAGVVRPGSKILTNVDGFPMSANVSAELTSRGCSEYNYASLIDTYAKECLKIKQLLVGADISFADGRMYDFVGNTVSPTCPGSRPSKDIVGANNGSDYDRLNTFVVYNSNLFSSVYGYTHKSSVSGDAFGDQILSYLKGVELSGLSAGQKILSPEQLNDSSIKKMSNADIALFSKKFILGCN